MATIYLATTGNDTTGVGSAGNPYATFTKCLNVASAGDTIIAKDGTYNQRIFVDGFAATELNPLTIRAENPLGAIIAGVSNTLNIVVLNDSDWVSVEDFYIQYASGHTVADKRDHHYVIIKGGSTHCTVQGCTITKLGLAPTQAAMTADYNAGYRQQGVAIRANVQYATIDTCEIAGINKGVGNSGHITFTTVRDCYIHDTVQSCLVFTAGDDTFGAHLIEDNILDYSHMEDGLQNAPGDGPDGTGTTVDTSGIIVRNNHFLNIGENIADTKGTEHVFFENNFFAHQVGSVDGWHPTLSGGPNTGSYNTINCGSNQITRHRVLRHNVSYNCNGGPTPWFNDCYYNNTFWYNRYNWSGSDTATDVTKHISINCTEGQQITNVGIKNNLIGRGYVGLGLRTHGGQDLDIDYNWYVNNDNIGANNTATVYYTTAATWKAFIAARGWNTEGEVNGLFTSTAAASIFTNVPEDPTADPDTYNFDLLITAPGHQTGGWLTRANGSGGSTTTLVVDNSYYFRDDFGRDDVDGDTIYIEGLGTRVVSAIDWDTHTITLDSAGTWSDGAHIWFGDSATPNIGAGTVASAPPDPEVSGGNLTPVGVGRAAATSGTQIIPITGLVTLDDDWCALVYVTAATTDVTPADHAMVSVGFTNSDGVERAIATRSGHGVNPASTVRRGTDTGCILIQNFTASGVNGQAQATGATASTFTLLWTFTPPAGLLVHVALFSSTAAHVGDYTLNVTEDLGVNVPTGFDFDLALVASNFRVVPTTSVGATFALSLGVAANTGSLQQACYSIKESSASPTTPVAHLRNDYVGANVTSAAGALDVGIEIGNLTSGGFDLTSRVNGAPTGSDAIVLAMTFDGLSCFVGTVDSPTVAGVDSITTIGFPPGFVGLINSMLTATNTAAADGTAGSFGMSLITTDAQYTLGCAIEDASTTSDTQSHSDDTALLLYQHDGSAGLAATLDSLDATGYTFEYTAVLPTARHSVVFAVAGTGQNITPSVSITTLATVNPTVVMGSMSITPAVAITTLSTIDPTAGGDGALASPDASITALSTIDPTVVKGATVVAPDVSAITLSTVAPTVSGLNLNGRVITLKTRRFTLTTPKRLGMSSIREILESPVEQGEDEEIPWVLNTTNWGGSPVSPVVTLKEMRLSGNVDVSDSLLTGDESVADNYITAPIVGPLTAGKKYRLEYRWDNGSTTNEAYCIIVARE